MKKTIFTVAIFVPILFGTALFVSAGNAKQWATFSNVAVDKQWSVTFNRSIDTTSISNNVYILNGSEKIAVTTAVANNILKIKPAEKLKNNKAYTLIVTNNVRDIQGKPMNQYLEIPFTTAATKMIDTKTAYKTFGSEYNMLWNMPSNDYNQFYLTGTKNGDQVGGYETRTGTEAFGIEVGASRGIVKAKYGEPLKHIKKNIKNYVQTYIDKYGNETSGTYLIDGNYVTFFYDTHKNNIVRSITWVTDETETTKSGFFATPSNDLRTSLENLMVELINEARVAEGLNILTYIPQHKEIARLHSTSMADNNYFNHTDLNGLRGGDRMKNAGLSFSWWGENLAYGQYSAIYAHEALMNSLGHRENILRDNFTHIFVGVDFNSKDQPYFTVNFYKI